jgi:hypothetical protein
MDASLTPSEVILSRFIVASQLHQHHTTWRPPGDADVSLHIIAVAVPSIVDRIEGLSRFLGADFSTHSTLPCAAVSADNTVLILDVATTSMAVVASAPYSVLVGAGASAADFAAPLRDVILTHRYDGNSLALLPAVPSAVRPTDIIVCVPSAVVATDLQRFGVERIAACCAPLQRALALHAPSSLFFGAMLLPGSGYGISCRGNLRDIDAGRWPQTAAYDGWGPPLLYALATAIVELRQHLPLPLPAVGLLEDADELVAAADARIAGAQSFARAASDTTDMVELLRLLGDTAVARLIGLRLTAGSVSAIARGIVPPSLPTLLGCFGMPHCLGQTLSVGARALTKHHHRDESDSWWGAAVSGTQARKNEQALRVVVDRILCDAVWRNVHMLPHDQVTFEVRCAKGYGARWVAAPVTASVDGAAVPTGQHDVTFRGFLEPQDADGHAKGWHH